MILSMTGYGKSVVVYNGKKINVEIKSLNSKALDLSTRIAPLYREKEMEIRQAIQTKVIRGKVDFSIWIEKDATTDATTINTALAKNYCEQIKNVAAECQIPLPGDWFLSLLRMPDVMSKVEIETLSDEEWTVARKAIDEAIDALVAFRQQEGAALQKKFGEKIDNIEALLKSIEPYEKSRVEKIRARRSLSTISRNSTSARRSSALPTTSTTSARLWLRRAARARSSDSSRRRWDAR